MCIFRMRNAGWWNGDDSFVSIKGENGLAANKIEIHQKNKDFYSHFTPHSRSTRGYQFIWLSIASALIFLLRNFSWVFRCLHPLSLGCRLRCECQYHGTATAPRCYWLRYRCQVQPWIPFPGPAIDRVVSTAYHGYPCPDSGTHDVDKIWMQPVPFADHSTIYRWGRFRVNIFQVGSTSNRIVDPTSRCVYCWQQLAAAPAEPGQWCRRGFPEREWNGRQLATFVWCHCCNRHTHNLITKTRRLYVCVQ